MEHLIHYMIIIFLGSLSTFKCEECIQSSTFNFNECDLALDGNNQSCSQTGLSSGSWWKVDFNGSKAISRFEIKGDLGFFEVRIGNNSDSLGHRKGFEANHLCLLSKDKVLKIRDGFVMFYCDFPINGKFFSMQHVDPCDPKVMSICNINFF